MNSVVFDTRFDTRRKGLEQIKISKSATNAPSPQNFIIKVARLVARTTLTRGLFTPPDRSSSFSPCRLLPQGFQMALWYVYPCKATMPSPLYEIRCLFIGNALLTLPQRLTATVRKWKDFPPLSTIISRPTASRIQKSKIEDQHGQRCLFSIHKVSLMQGFNEKAWWKRTEPVPTRLDSAIPAAHSCHISIRTLLNHSIHETTTPSLLSG